MTELLGAGEILVSIITEATIELDSERHALDLADKTARLLVESGAHRCEALRGCRRKPLTPRIEGRAGTHAPNVPRRVRSSAPYRHVGVVSTPRLPTWIHSRCMIERHW
jgi:hypothetical protein